MPIGKSRSVAPPRGSIGNASGNKRGTSPGTKRFHHKPVFGGDVAKTIAQAAASVSGQLTIFVQNANGDDRFRPGAILGQYGTFLIDAKGAYTYTPAVGNATIAGMAAGSTLTETFKARSHYDYRGHGFVDVVITIQA